MDVYILPRYVPPDAPPPPPFMPTIYKLARTWRGERYHRYCNAMESAAGKFGHRLSTWFNPSDYFDNRTTLEIIARYHLEMESIIMPAKRKSTSDFNRESSWKGFLEYRLTDLELMDADQQVITDEELLECYIKLVEEGYKMTASYKAETKTATATMQAGDSLPKLTGWALSAKGRDPREALKLLFYKHYECLKEDWLPLLSAEKPVQRG